MMVRWLMDCDALMSCGPNYQTIQTSHPFSTEFRLAGPQLLWLWLFHIHIHHSHPSTSISYPCISHSWTKPHFVMLVSSLPILPSSTRRYTDRQLGLNDLERDFIKTLCTLSHLHDNSTRLSIPNSRLTKKTHTHTKLNSISSACQSDCHNNCSSSIGIESREIPGDKNIPRLSSLPPTSTAGTPSFVYHRYR